MGRLKSNFRARWKIIQTANQLTTQNEILSPFPIYNCLKLHGLALPLLPLSCMSNEEIKIRALPRGTEKSEKPEDKKKDTAKKAPRWIIYVSTTSAFLLLAVAFHGPHRAKRMAARAKGKVDLASAEPKTTDTVTRHLQEAEIKREIMQREAELQNEPFNQQIKGMASEDEIATLPENRNFGVHLDSDDSADRVFDDLNVNSQGYDDRLPADKINARLANRQWANEEERRERIEFIGNFIRSAYERGYELEIDQNLVVVGVHRIPRDKKININQVIDRLAKQGI